MPAQHASDHEVGPPLLPELDGPLMGALHRDGAVLDARGAHEVGRHSFQSQLRELVLVWLVVCGTGVHHFLPAFRDRMDYIALGRFDVGRGVLLAFDDLTGREGNHGRVMGHRCEE